MCRDVKQDTKQKIALALRQLMQERPLRKITVQDLMERAQMTRQSFYYHFQDIRDVLAWICEQQLSAPLREAQELSFEDWMMKALLLMEEDRGFYRQILSYTDSAFLLRFCDELLRPRMVQLLFGEQSEQNLDDRRKFVVDFSIQAAQSCLTGMLSTRRGLEEEEARARLRCLLDALSLNGAVRPCVQGD